MLTTNNNEAQLMDPTDSSNPRFAFFHNIGSPKKIVAPMVDQSDLAFRILTRQYGAELCFTQMYNANSMVNASDYMEENFQTIPEDRPLIAQIAG